MLQLIDLRSDHRHFPGNFQIAKNSALHYLRASCFDSSSEVWTKSKSATVLLHHKATFLMTKAPETILKIFAKHLWTTVSVSLYLLGYVIGAVLKQSHLEWFWKISRKNLPNKKSIYLLQTNIFIWYLHFLCTFQRLFRFLNVSYFREELFQNFSSELVTVLPYVYINNINAKLYLRSRYWSNKTLKLLALN